MSWFSDLWNDATGVNAQRERDRLAMESRAAGEQEREAARIAEEDRLRQEQEARQTTLQAEAQRATEAEQARQAGIRTTEAQNEQARQAALAQLAQQQADATTQQQAADAARTARVSGARASGTSQAQQYFRDRGVDPSGYDPLISAAIDKSLTGANPDNLNLTDSLGGIGAQVYANQTDAARQRAQTGLRQAGFGQDFELSRISSTLDDPLLAEIEAKQRGDADAYINNLLKRQVITPTGQAAASRKLDEQAPRVRTALADVGNLQLESGRQSLRDIANRGFSNASTLDLSSTFDPGTYKAQADQSFDEFMKTLGDRVRSSVPDKLYDTSGLGAVAGMGQGPQNLRWDPQALAGIVTDTGEPIDPTIAEEERRKKERALF